MNKRVQKRLFTFGGNIFCSKENINSRYLCQYLNANIWPMYEINLKKKKTN